MGFFPLPTGTLASAVHTACIEISAFFAIVFDLRTPIVTLQFPVFAWH
jgi:hypothetical protein